MPIRQADGEHVIMTPGGMVNRDTAIASDPMLWGDARCVALCLLHREGWGGVRPGDVRAASHVYAAMSGVAPLTAAAG